jgi:uncharacterized protein YjbI with pentapeptide repeats
LPTNWSLVTGYLIGPEAPLAGADFSGANLTDTDLAGANLTGANLSGATLTGVRSGGIIGTPASLPTNWSLVTGYLIGPYANLSGADLSGANFNRADLAGANLSDSNLSGVDLSGANLQGVRSGGIVGTPASLPPGWALVNGYFIRPVS